LGGGPNTLWPPNQIIGGAMAPLSRPHVIERVLWLAESDQGDVMNVVFSIDVINQEKSYITGRRHSLACRRTDLNEWKDALLTARSAPFARRVSIRDVRALNDNWFIARLKPGGLSCKFT